MASPSCRPGLTLATSAPGQFRRSTSPRGTAILSGSRCWAVPACPCAVTASVRSAASLDCHIFHFRIAALLTATLYCFIARLRRRIVALLHAMLCCNGSQVRACAQLRVAHRRAVCRRVLRARRAALAAGARWCALTSAPGPRPPARLRIAALRAPGRPSACVRLAAQARRSPASTRGGGCTATSPAHTTGRTSTARGRGGPAQPRRLGQRAHVRRRNA